MTNVTAMQGCGFMAVGAMVAWLALCVCTRQELDTHGHLTPTAGVCGTFTVPPGTLFCGLVSQHILRHPWHGMEAAPPLACWALVAMPPLLLVQEAVVEWSGGLPWRARQALSLQVQARQAAAAAAQQDLVRRQRADAVVDAVLRVVAARSEVATAAAACMQQTSAAADLWRRLAALEACLHTRN